MPWLPKNPKIDSDSPDSVSSHDSLPCICARLLGPAVQSEPEADPGNGTGLPVLQARSFYQAQILFEAQVAAGHDMKELGVRMEQSEFKAQHRSWFASIFL